MGLHHEPIDSSGKPRPRGPGREAAVLFGGLVVSFATAVLVAAPFDLDVGAGHAVFHFLLALGVALTSALLWRLQPPSRRLASRFARWSTALLAAAQLVEGIATVFDPDGSGTAHAIPNAAGLAVLQPLVLISLIALVVAALIHRRNARV